MTDLPSWSDGYFVAAQDWPARRELGLTTDQVYAALDEMDDYYDAAVASLQAEQLSDPVAPRDVSENDRPGSS